MSTPDELIILGWREWIALPELDVERIKAKVDTGARTSCLHAFFVETYSEKGSSRVRFGVHPLQRNSEKALICDAELIDQRTVSDSGGHREKRCVIATVAVIGERRQQIELTLTNRDSMRFRVLLGRTALAGHYCVDPSLSYRFGKPGSARSEDLASGNTFRPSSQ